MGIEPTTFQTLVGCSKHWATKKSSDDLSWNRIIIFFNWTEKFITVFTNPLYVFEHSRPIHHTKSDIFETAYICKRTGLRPNESSESAHQNRIFQTDLQSGLRLFFQRNLGKQMYGFKNGVEGALHSQTVHTNSDVHQTTSDLFVNESAVRPPETTESAVRNHDLF